MSRYKTDNKQPRFRYSVLARCVAWANISVQVLFSTRSHLYASNGSTVRSMRFSHLSMENTTVTADNNVEKKMSRRLPLMPGHFKQSAR